MNSQHWVGLANLLQSVTGTAPPETASIEDLINSLYAFSQAQPSTAGPEPAMQGVSIGAPNPNEARFWAPAPPPVPGYDPSFTSYAPQPGVPPSVTPPSPTMPPPGRVPPGQPVPPGSTSPGITPTGPPQPAQPAPGANYFKTLSATTGRVRTPWAANTSASAYGSSRLSQLMGMGRAR